MLTLVARLPGEHMTGRVLVNGVIGIEDSSRRWSPAMVLEHVVIVGDMVTDIVVDLSHGRVPTHHVRIADLKPSGGMPPEQALSGFGAFVKRYETRVKHEVGDRHSEARWKHPWFGELNAKQWHCLSGLHLGIHRRQMAAIVKG
jgi:hypothetical protein